MIIEELQQAHKAKAALLGEYRLMSVTELANAYCDADEAYKKLKEEGAPTSQVVAQESKRSSCFSALVLHYWGNIFKWAADSASLLTPYDEHESWLTESLGIAFRYRAWRTPYKMRFGKHSHEVEGYELDAAGKKIPNPYYYVNDPNAPDKIFNRCIFSARGRAYQFANKQKRKDGVHKLSLDALIDEDGDFAASYTGAYVEEGVFKHVAELIKILLHKGELKEALVVDGIAHFDTFKEEKKKKSEEETPASIFDARKLVKHLNTIDKKYAEGFCMQYEVPAAATQDALNDANFKEMHNSRIYRCIKKTLQEIKQTPALLDCLL